ncbi:hypothetical protein [Mycetohabitans endofungorum]|uniref:hypothetical protein n=1 Tax=Mycetohabitans endofungorum TaxID=417203 RepID=UPI002B054AD6|nr:hypothetical protein [Mycetohabitans endofungorum]
MASTLTISSAGSSARASSTAWQWLGLIRDYLLRRDGFEDRLMPLRRFCRGGVKHQAG